jgi:tetraacyldisaccharide 4'-kinase
VSLLLRPLELLYRGVNRLRRGAYRRGIVKGKRLPRPVVSVGNIAIGGAGKTPATITLARLLHESGLRVCILTRGYGRQSQDVRALVDAPDAARFGDEPVVIASALPGVPVVVGKRRYESAMWFLAIDDCDLFLLDDGMQHLQLARDCDLVVLSERARWYREGPAALRDVDALLVRADAIPSASSRKLVASSTPHPTFRAVLHPTRIRRRNETEALETLANRRVIAFSGLADNGQFFDSLRRLGATVVKERPFPDHHVYSADEVRLLRELAAKEGAELITTAKDAVKLTSGGASMLDLDLLVLMVEMQIEKEAELLDLVLEKCRLTT